MMLGGGMSEEEFRAYLRGMAQMKQLVGGGNTPLMVAAYRGNDEACRVLVQIGADLDLCNDNNLTAVDIAERVGNSKTAHTLRLMRDSPLRHKVAKLKKTYPGGDVNGRV